MKLLSYSESLLFLGSGAARRLYAEAIDRIAQSPNLRRHYPTNQPFEHFDYAFRSTLTSTVCVQAEIRWEDHTPEPVLLVSEDGEPAVMLALCSFDSPDRGRMYSLLTDLGTPLVQRFMHEILPSDLAVPVGDKLLVLTPEGRGDYVVPLDGTFADFLKSHGQVSRYWRKCPEMTLDLRSAGVSPALSPDENLRISLENTEHHLMRGHEIPFAAVRLDSDVFHVTMQDGKRREEFAVPVDAHSFDPIFTWCPADETLVTRVDGVAVALSYLEFDYINNDIYWVNTVRLRKDESLPKSLRGLPLGNLVLLQIIENLYRRNYASWTFNLGIDIFDYKLAWKPVRKWCPGFDTIAVQQGEAQ